MARGPQQQTRQFKPSQADVEGAVAGEVVESTERAMTRHDNTDLDASLAVALSEAEINQQIATARRFPRPKQKAMDDLTDLACQTTEVATACVYSLPRGRDPETGKPKAITGASIRFAELCAQVWGNCRVAARVIAVDRKEKFVEAEGIYHDLETNYAVAARVRRRISGKNGSLFSDDMIIVTGNAAASIALRNAILRGIPRPVWQTAYAKVEATVAGDSRTIGARRVELLTRFRDELGVKPHDLFKILGVTGELDIGRDELVIAAGFFTALRNNEVTAEDLLREAAAPNMTARTLAAGYAEPQASPPPPPAPPPPPQPPPAAEARPEPPQGEQAASDDQKDGGYTVLGGPAPAGMLYGLDTEEGTADGDEQGYPVFRDGEMVERRASNDWDGLPIYEAHAPRPEPPAAHVASSDRRHPTAARTAAPDSPTSGSATHASEASPAPTASSQPAQEPPPPGGEATDLRKAAPGPLDGAIGEFRAACAAAESWLQIKAALGRLRKVAAFAELPDEMQAAERVYAYQHGAALAAAGKDPVTTTDDPSFFVLWLDTAPPRGEIEVAFAQLIRSAAYRALKDEQKDLVAEARTRAMGDDL